MPGGEKVDEKSQKKRPNKWTGADVNRWDVAKLWYTSEDARERKKERERERDCEGRVYELRWTKATGIFECTCQCKSKVGDFEVSIV